MKRVGLVIVLAFLLLFTMFTVFWNVALVKGYDTIIIHADGSVSGTANIENADNATYTFTGNINGSILVQRNNIVIDGAGYTLRGEGGLDEYGINLIGITNVTIRSTQIVNFRVGVYLQTYSNNNTITENTFLDNRFGIELDVSHYNTISENIMTDNDNGIWLDTATSYDGGSNYNIISGNNITLCFYEAIGLANESSNNTIIGNNAVNNQYGITLSVDCSDNLVSRNFIDETQYGWGIKLEGTCDQNLVSDNNIKNTGYGIWLDRVSDNNITRNIVANSDQAVRFYKASNNRFWHNNFVDNSQQVYFDGDSYTNVWDDGYPSGGNYWSDYSGVDSNNGLYQNLTGSDGIGDTPYAIDGGNQDNYPLMSPYVDVSEDNTPPTTSDNYDGAWHTSDFTIILTATDDLSGVAETYYKINDGATKTVSSDGQPAITTEGADNTLEYWSEDNIGNEETPHTLTDIKLDKTAPTGSITINDGAASTTSTSVTLTLTYTDTMSGVHQVRYSNDGTWNTEQWQSPSTTKTWTLTSGDGTKTVHYQIIDNAGNTNSYSDSISLQEPEPSPSPSPTPTPSPSPSPSPSPEPTSSPSPSPEPTSTPTPPPEEPPLSSTTIIVIAVVVTFAVIGVAAFMLKKK
jgi:parallel beta-helix repeat protein